ncbi:unnamed protein product, partial [Sphacelaria rigidula]
HKHIYTYARKNLSKNCCSEIFLAGDLGECLSHTQEACFGGNSNSGSADGGVSGGRSTASFRLGSPAGEDFRLEGHYPCCGQKAYRFNLEPPPLGCTTGDHTTSEANEDPLVLRVLRLQRHNITYQDWRAAVEEETQAAVESVVGNLEGTNGITTKTINTNMNKTPRQFCSTTTHIHHYPHHGGTGGSGDASTTSGGTQGEDRGIMGGGGGSGGCGESGGLVDITTSEACASSAVGIDNTHRQRNDIADVTSPGQDGGGEGGGARGARGKGAHEEAAVADRATGDRDGNGDTTMAGTQMEQKGVKERTRGGGSGGGCGVIAAAAAPAGGQFHPAIASLGYFRRIWELQASEALSARERGLLPNEHPVQIAPEVKVEWDLARMSESRNNATLASEGALRRWQTDTLRENDGQRMAQLCEELRRKRGGE